MTCAYMDCRVLESQPLLKRLLAIRERAYGDHAAALLWILAELAEGYADEGAKEAEPVLERSFEVLRTFLSAGKPLRRYAMDWAGNKEVLEGGNGRGVLEKLVRASKTFHFNLKKRWGA